jgi:hypothetical protein
VDGTVYCKFIRVPITKVENREFNLAKDKYHLLVAAGSTVHGEISLSIMGSTLSTLDSMQVVVMHPSSQYSVVTCIRYQ